MKKIRDTLFVVLSVLIFQQINAQDSLTWALGTIAVTRNGNEIGIGDKVPDIPFEKMLNFPVASTTLHELNNKPVIIEFWHQYCSVCRSEIPKLNDLYQQYKDSVQFLMVTFQSEASIKEFLQQQSKAGKEILLPLVVEDTMLRKTFGHDGDPHVVWISNEGEVQAISNHTALNKEHIAQWLKEKQIKLALKSSQKDFDVNKPLFTGNNDGLGNAIKFRSLLTGYIDSIPAVPFLVTQTGNQTKVLMTNATIDQLYKECYMRYDTATAQFLDLDWMNKRVLYNYKDSSRVSNWTNAHEMGYDQLEHFQQQHMYSYELIVPGALNSTDAAAYTLQELKRLFHISAAVKSTTINGLALIRLNNNDKFKTKGITASRERSTQDSVMMIQDREMWSLINVLNLNYNFPYVVDETGYLGKVDITIPFLKKNPEAVRQRLQTYGLDLISKEYNIPMLILEKEEE